jgi:anthranilate synthase/aminodeoxychorismate synthase-like glutamine amidotransferase
MSLAFFGCSDMFSAFSQRLRPRDLDVGGRPGETARTYLPHVRDVKRCLPHSSPLPRSSREGTQRVTSWCASTHMLLVVDNHDSFTWNLVHALGRFLTKLAVVQADEVNVDAVRAMAPRGIVLSPGPGRPEHAGVSLALVRELAPSTPLLGVCLGHQVICAAFGAHVVHAPRLMHGRTSPITHDGQGLFRDLPSPLRVARYHSLIVDAHTLPSELVATAFTEQGELMAVRHTSLPIESVQFHPESFMTECGLALLARFVERIA